MNLNSRYNVLFLSGIFLLLLAVNFFEINHRYIFLAASAAIIIVSLQGGWANGVFMALIFNFIFYSLHMETTIESLFINTAVYSALAVLAGRVKISRNAVAPREDAEEKVFVNKVINAFMLAHDVLWEIKKGITHSELLSLFARNVTNLVGARHVLIYSADPEKDRSLYELAFSSGIYQDKAIERRVKLEELEPGFSKGVDARSFGCIKDPGAGYAVCVPIKDEGNIKDIIVLYREENFFYVDIYIAEFFAAQVFVILEKQSLLRRMADNYEKIIEALALAIDTKDHLTHGHSMNTMKYAVKIAQKMNVGEDEMVMIRYAALLHDIGKINISSAILNKPSALTPDEFERVKKHPEEGVEILNRMGIFGEILPLVLYHHEHYNGAGYPEKLKGKEIPLGARICSIADAYSVMRSDRPYRKARSRDEAVEELKKCSGSQFDGEIVDVFLEIINGEEDSLPGAGDLTGRLYGDSVN